MIKISCLIVDDEPLALGLLEKYVHQTPFLELAGKCETALEALEKIQSNPVELLFLDIQMPGLTGMELSRSLKEGPKIVFTTAYESYALEGYKVDAVDYLLKPFSYAEFLTAAQKAQKLISLETQNKRTKEPGSDYIIVKSEYHLVQVAVNDILYIDGLKDYIRLHLQNGEAIMTLMSMKAMEEKLQDE